MCSSADCCLQYSVALRENKGSPSLGLCLEGYQGNNRFSDQFMLGRIFLNLPAV